MPGRREHPVDGLDSQVSASMHNNGKAQQPGNSRAEHSEFLGTEDSVAEQLAGKNVDNQGKCDKREGRTGDKNLNAVDALKRASRYTFHLRLHTSLTRCESKW